jgi:uncharacterized protein
MLILALIAAISLPPKPDHFVTDRAGVIANPSALDARLAQFERETSDQILVYVDQHLPPDTTIEEMGSEAIKQWGVGQKGKDNGAILFVFIADRKMRIEVGYGLEGALTDAKSRNIIETVIKPRFKSGDYSGGVEQGVAAIMATIRGEPYKGSGATVAQRRVQIGWMTVVIPLLLIVVFVILIVRAVRSGVRSIGTTVGGSGSSQDDSWSSSSSDSSSSSSSSSDSFDGGGGSSGGGGASGSW